MAREIHDTLAQGLTGIITQLQAAEQAGRRPGRAAPAPRRRAPAGQGQPDRGPPLGATPCARAAGAGRLREALAGVAERWSVLHGVPAQVTTTGTARPMPPEAEITLLRTAQEALANVAKHARAGRVGLTLSYMEDQVTLDIRDDGAGFDPRPSTGQRRVRPDRHAAAGRGRWPGRCRSSPSPAPAPPISASAPGRCARASEHRGPGRARPTARDPWRRPPIRLLIADDHPVVRDGLSGMFSARPGVRGASARRATAPRRSAWPGRWSPT